jgi:5-methylthioribose kinase
MSGAVVVDPAYEPLSAGTLDAKLSLVEPVARRLGCDGSVWACREVGDGNLNLVFIVEGRARSLVIKQALPYVRLIAESWPLPLSRSFFEFHALTRQAERDTLGFAGVEMHRRILGLAHISEFEEITDPAVRAPGEARALRLGRQNVVNRGAIRTTEEVCSLARLLEKDETR